jgi:glutaminase
MAATLANRGVNPLTGERALQERQVVRVLSVMNTCGMYDFTGEWVFRVGIPAKSGVSGAIIAVVPGQLGFAVFSPPLDRRGNSVRGIAVCEELSQHFNLHINRAHASGSSVVRRAYHATTVRSKRNRSALPAEALRGDGERIAVFELQGDLFFATTEALSRAVEPALGTALYLVLDCRRVGYIDHGAFEVLADLVALAQARGAVAVLAEAGFILEDDMVPASLVALRSFEDADSALEWCEDRLLEWLAVPGEPTDTGLGDQEVLRGLDADALAVLHGCTELQTFVRGTNVFSEGDTADRMFFLLSGRVSVQLTVGDHTRRLASIGPGAAFGEMALLDEGSRSSTVVADEDAVCRSLSRHSISELEHGPAPEIVAILMKNLAKSLSRRLRETNGAVRALE